MKGWVCIQELLFHCTHFHRNLKSSIFRHLEDHCTMDVDDDAPVGLTEKAGMTVARVCFFIFKEALPYTKFESLLHLQTLNSGDIGNINNSFNFCSSFLTSLSETLKDDVKNFLSTPLPCTGAPVPLAVSDDLGTYQVYKCFISI